MPSRKKDLEEIFLHVQHLRKEKQPLEEQSVSDEPAFRWPLNVSSKKSDVISAPFFSVPAWNDASPAVCDFCHHVIILGKNLSGLVMNSEHFVCESCCQQRTTRELQEWTKTKMTKGNTLRPIGLWLTEEKNR